MKKNLLFSFFLAVLSAVTLKTAAQPTVSYNPTNNYPVGAAIPILSPTSSGVGTFAYGTITPFTGATLTNPYEMALDGNGYLYVANQGANNVLKYTSPTTGAIFITTLANATTVAFDNTGLPYAGKKGGTINKYTTAGGFTSQVTAAPSSALGMAIDASNNIFIADYTGSSIYKYSTAGTLLQTINLAALAPAGKPSSVAVDGNGFIYVLDFTNKQVLKFNSAGTLVATPVTGLSATSYAVNVDNSGNIYVGDSGNTSVKVYAPAGGAAIATITGISDPRGVLPDSKGNLYVSNFTTASSSVTRYSPAGGYFLSYAAGTTSLIPGLTFDSKTGNITGTPSVAASGTYTVTAYNAAGQATTSASFTINCAVPPTISYTGSPFSYTVGTAITTLVPATTNSPTSYAISPSLNANTGLTFSTGTGQISGTPTIVSGPVNYSVTATNAGGTSPAAVISIQVYPKVPTIAYTGSPFTFGVGVSIGTPLSPATTNSPTSYTISPNLGTNTGLSFDPTTGIISGTPTTASAAVTYTISAYNANPTPGTTTISITVVNPPTIAYTGSPYSYSVGTAIGSLTPATTNSPTSYSISPDITANTGLSFSTSTGVISGTPTTVSAPVTYTVTANNIAGSGNTTISVQVYPKIPTIAYTGSPFTFGTGIAIGSPLTPATTNSPTSYTISPNLTTNTGLSFDPATGIISGTPTTASAAVSYTISAYNANPTPGTTTISIAVVNPPTVAYTGSPFSYTISSAIPTLTPTTTSSPTSFSISPGLTANTGLSFNTSTGVISGTPTILSAPVTYTVTATNAGGSGNTTLSIAVYPVRPTISYTGSPFTYYQGQPITSLTPATTNSPTSFTISPNLTTNTGLSFDPATGIISGTPTSPYPATTYTISAYNANPTPGTTTVSILVYGVPVLTYPAQSPFTAGVAISPFSPSNSGGPVAASLNYGSGTVLTGGTVNNPQEMGIDPTTGDVYVANASGSINVWDSNGVFIRNIALAGSSPVGIVFDSSGNAYVLDATTKRVYSFTGNPPGNLNLASRTAITGAGIVTQPTAIAIDAQGAIYVSDYSATGTGGGTGEVYKFVGSGSSYSLFYTYNNNPLQNASGVAVDNSGYVYVTNESATAGYKRVVRYNPTGGGFIALVTQLNNASSVFVDGGGNIYVSNNGTNTINIYSAAGGSTPTTTIAVTNPSGVIVDGKGNVFVSTGGNQVIKFPVTGGYNISGPLPQGLNFNNTTGAVSGTPLYGFPATTYTVTAYNIVGAGSTTFTISCTINPPIIAYNPNNYTFALNTAITPVSPINSGGPIPATPSFGPPNIILKAANGLNNPWGVATDPSGNVYAVNYTGNTVTKYSTAGVASTFIASLPTPNPIGIVFDSSGNAYVLTTSGLYVYNPAGVYQSAIVFTGIVTATGIAIDAANNLYVASSNSNLTKYPASGGPGNVLFTASGGYRITGGVAVDSEGSIYVCDNYGTPSVDQYDQYGNLNGVFSFANNTYGVAVDGGNNVYLAGTNQVQVFDQNAKEIAVLTGLTDPRAVVPDSKGNIYVSDYTNNTVTKYAPVSGYYLTGGLPPGLLFSDATGTFSGTPTTQFPPTTLTVTAYNSAGGNSTTVTFTCGSANYWHGINAGNTDWNTPSNWSAGTVPTSADVAYIGTANPITAGFKYLPTISAGESITVSGVVMGSANYYSIAPGIVANNTGVLNVTTNITYQGDNYSGRNFTAALSGTGTIKTVSVIVSATYNLHLPYTLSMSSSVNSLQISGPISLVAGVTNKGTKFFNPVFSVTGGTTTLAGTFQSTNIANAGSISTFAVQNGLLQLSNSTAFSGLSSSGTNVVTFNGTGAVVEYSGASQTVYTDATLPNLATGPSYYSIKFSGTGTKTLNGTATSNLNVAGDFTNLMSNISGSNILVNNTIVNFNGTTQTLAGGPGQLVMSPTIATPTITGTVFNKVTFSGAGTKTMSTGVFSVQSTGVLTMLGTSPLNILNANGLLTLRSDASSTATVAQIPTGPSITGNVSVQRWVTGGTGYRGYRLMTSPVWGSTSGSTKIYSLNYLMGSIYLKGTSGIGFDGAGNDNIYLYRENIAPSGTTYTGGNYNGINSLVSALPVYAFSYPIDGNTTQPNFSIPIGAGYLVFFRGDRKVDTYTNETATTYVPTNTIITATGTLNQGPVSPNDWYTPSSPYLGYTTTSGNSTVQGFNLVGNPYASSINWETYGTAAGSGIQVNNVGNTVYELNPKTYNFDTYQVGGIYTNNGSKVIASGQGIFVVAANATNPQITFNESAKVNTQNTGLNLLMATRDDVASVRQTGRNTNNAHLRLQLAMDTVNTDDIYIGFSNTAKSTYVFNEDAPYRTGQGKLGLSSMSDDHVPLAINMMSMPKTSQAIKLNVTATADGSFTLNMKEMAGIPAKYEIWLKDAKLNDSVAMSAGAAYSFTITHADTTTFGAHRFSLVIKDDPALRIKLLDFAAVKVTGGARIDWKVKNEGSNALFTVQRSTDKGLTFDDIGTVASNSTGTYIFTDRSPVVPEDRYRLKVINGDSSIAYSKVATLTYTGLNDGTVAKSRIIVFPNPATSTVNMAILQNTGILDGALNWLGASLIDDHFQKPDIKPVKASYNIRVFNNLGSVVRDITSSEPVWQTNVSSLLPGTYVIQVTNDTTKTDMGKATFVKL